MDDTKNNKSDARSTVARTPELRALMAMCEELGIDITDPSSAASALIVSDQRAWLLRQELMSAAALETLSDGSVGFYASGVMAERNRVRDLAAAEVKPERRTQTQTLTRNPRDWRDA